MAQDKIKALTDFASARVPLQNQLGAFPLAQWRWITRTARTTDTYPNAGARDNPRKASFRSAAVKRRAIVPAEAK
ncbi:hypothetical protein AAU01_18760 [Paenarthrobacter aurescens]|uniref:Uncharacterized protein n=2 Tax=Paenarthrobacter aurescens TaxID=43663 RepID=A0A4Y3NJE0_PAEAU|nr:hypothetical protein AAU01_18760 [Paenarthrobacter aurescens]